MRDFPIRYIVYMAMLNAKHVGTRFLLMTYCPVYKKMLSSSGTGT